MEAAGDLRGSRDRTKAPYLVGVVVRVANHSVHPVWFRRAKGTNGCLRFGVFTSAVTNKQKTIKIYSVFMTETLLYLETASTAVSGEKELQAS